MSNKRPINSKHGYTASHPRESLLRIIRDPQYKNTRELMDALTSHQIPDVENIEKIRVRASRVNQTMAEYNERKNK